MFSQGDKPKDIQTSKNNKVGNRLSNTYNTKQEIGVSDNNVVNTNYYNFQGFSHYTPAYQLIPKKNNNISLLGSSFDTSKQLVQLMESEKENSLNSDSSPKQEMYTITSNASPIVAVGRSITYNVKQNQHHFIQTGSKYRYRWYCENDVETQKKYTDASEGVPDRTERSDLSNWFDETFGNPQDITMKAVYPGIHDIKVDVYLDETYLATSVYRQIVIEGDPEILAMSFKEKFLEVYERCSFFDAMYHELGGWEGIKKLVAWTVGSAVVLGALASSGYGLAAEIIIGIAAAVAFGVSISKVIHGIYKIVEAMELIRVAASDAALNDAAEILEAAGGEVIINGIFALLSYFGMKGAKSKIETRLAKGEKVFTRTRTPLSEMAPGSPGHKAQRWIEYQMKNPDKYPNVSEVIEPKWSRMYDTIIQNSRAGRGFEVEALTRFKYSKNNHMFLEPGQKGGFIPDAIKGNPVEIKWGKPYHFVEVKGWNNLSNTGNLKSMLLYVKKHGGSIELIIRSEAHSSGATSLSGPLSQTINQLRLSGQATIKTYP